MAEKIRERPWYGDSGRKYSVVAEHLQTHRLGHQLRHLQDLLGPEYGVHTKAAQEAFKWAGHLLNGEHLTVQHDGKHMPFAAVRLQQALAALVKSKHVQDRPELHGHAQALLSNYNWGTTLTHNLLNDALLHKQVSGRGMGRLKTTVLATIRAHRNPLHRRAAVDDLVGRIVAGTHEGHADVSEALKARYGTKEAARRALLRLFDHMQDKQDLHWVEETWGDRKHHARLSRLGDAEWSEGWKDRLPHPILADKLEENDWHHDRETLDLLRGETDLYPGEHVLFARHPVSGKVKAWVDKYNDKLLDTPHKLVETRAGASMSTGLFPDRVYHGPHGLFSVRDNLFRPGRSVVESHGRYGMYRDTHSRHTSVGAAKEAAVRAAWGLEPDVKLSAVGAMIGHAVGHAVAALVKKKKKKPKAASTAGHDHFKEFR